MRVFPGPIIGDIAPPAEPPMRQSGIPPDGRCHQLTWVRKRILLAGEMIVAGNVEVHLGPSCQRIVLDRFGQERLLGCICSKSWSVDKDLPSATPIDFW